MTNKKEEREVTNIRLSLENKNWLFLEAHERTLEAKRSGKGKISQSDIVNALLDRERGE